MTSNNNVILLSIKADGLYKPGDVFHVKGIYRNDPRLMKFDGLVIKNVDYCFGVRLHFDLAEWSTSKKI